MEIVLFGVVALAAIFAAVATAGLVATGRHRHTRAGLAEGKTMATGAAGIVIIGGLWLFGPWAMLAAWPFFVAAGVALGLYFAWYRRAIPAGDAPRQTLEARDAELRAQGKPTDWIDGIQARRARRGR